jgi:hypothetical protein
MIYFYLLETFALIFLFMAVLDAQSQSRVNRKVTSDDGSALTRISIVEKGKRNGTVTHAKSNDSFSAGKNDILVFSFVSFTTQEVPGSGSTFNLSKSHLDEPSNEEGEVLPVTCFVIDRWMPAIANPERILERGLVTVRNVYP